MTGARTRGAELWDPLRQAGAVVGLLAVALLVASATVAFTAKVQHAMPSPPTLTTTATIEGAAP